MQRFRWHDAPISMHSTNARRDTETSPRPVGVVAQLQAMNARARAFWTGREEEEEAPTRDSAAGQPGALARMNKVNRAFWRGRL